MKKKNYILDDGKIGDCIYNIKQMNPFEYCYCQIFYWEYFRYKISDIWDLLKEIFTDVLSIFGILIVTLFMPLFAWIIIKDYRKQWGNK